MEAESPEQQKINFYRQKKATNGSSFFVVEKYFFARGLAAYSRIGFLQMIDDLAQPLGNFFDRADAVDGLKLPLFFVKLR